MKPDNQALITALQALLQEVRWKPGKASRHLRTRRLAGHIREETTLTEYEDIIRSVVGNPQARIYRYDWSESSHYAVAVADWQDHLWLVMVSLEGVMETAFLIDRDGYLEQDSRYVLIGRLHDLEPKSSETT